MYLISFEGKSSKICRNAFLFEVWSVLYVDCFSTLINISLSLYLAFQPIRNFSLLNLSRCLVLLAPVVCPSVALPCCSTRSKRCMSRHTKRKSRGRIRETWSADSPSTPAAPPY